MSEYEELLEKFDKSDMAGWERPPKTAEEGADTAVFLASLPAAGAPTGKFFSDRRERGW